MTNPIAASAQLIDRHIGERIRQIRQERGISLQTLAAAIGVTYQQVQKYETGGNRVSASTLYLIIGHLDVGLDAIFEGLDTPSTVTASNATTAMGHDATRGTAAEMARLPPSVRKHIGALIRAIDQQQR